MNRICRSFVVVLLLGPTRVVRRCIGFGFSEYSPLGRLMFADNSWKNILTALILRVRVHVQDRKAELQ